MPIRWPLPVPPECCQTNLDSVTHSARLEKLKAQKSKAERAMDTRRKIIAGALILEIMKKDKDIASVLSVEMKALATDADFALLNLSAHLGRVQP